MKRVLITGASGMLGMELAETLRPVCHVYPLDRSRLDVTDKAQVESAFGQAAPDVVFHTAAYTRVDTAEKDPHEAVRVNGLGTMHIAAAAEAAGAKLVYVSSDYVFDGAKGSPYVERDEPSPINKYGWSKLIGEHYASALCTRLFIVRTSWLYGRYGFNFVKNVLWHASGGTEMRVVMDQTGSPTSAADLCVFLGRLIETDDYGTYHAANRGACSWYEFASAIVQLAGCRPVIVPCRTEEFRRAALRPVYSALDSVNVPRDSRLALRDWRSALQDYLAYETGGLQGERGDGRDGEHGDGRDG